MVAVPVDGDATGVHGHYVGDQTGGGESEEDSVEELARHLYGIESSPGAFGYGVFLLSSEIRHDFVTSWDDADDSTKRSYRQRARRVVADRRKNDRFAE